MVFIILYRISSKISIGFEKYIRMNFHEFLCVFAFPRKQSVNSIDFYADSCYNDANSRRNLHAFDR